jgi:hypothetical protein
MMAGIRDDVAFRSIGFDETKDARMNHRVHRWEGQSAMLRECFPRRRGAFDKIAWPSDGLGCWCHCGRLVGHTEEIIVVNSDPLAKPVPDGLVIASAKGMASELDHVAAFPGGVVSPAGAIVMDAERRRAILAERGSA